MKFLSFINLNVFSFAALKANLFLPKKEMMKKAFLLFGFAALTVASANAQVNDEFKTFKPLKGAVTAELGLAGGLNNADFTLNEGASGLLRFRYFAKERLAFRLGVNVSATSETDKVYGTGVDLNREGESTVSSTGFLLNLGVEKHFKGTPRLSPYVAGDILFGVMGQRMTAENSNGTNYIPQFSAESKGPGNFSIGLRGVVGADYYIAKHVYIGAEAGLGFLNSIDGGTETTTTIGNTTTTVKTKSVGSSFELAPSVITGIRIGFVF